MAEFLDPNPSSVEVMSQQVLLHRISRELDCFGIKLLQVEENVASVVESYRGNLPETVIYSLQSIDYVSQASVALSLLLAEMSQEPDADLDELLSHVVPTDLRERLRNEILGDVDATANDIEFF